MSNGPIFNGHLCGTVFFGVFGQRDYREILIVSVEVGAATIACRWCVGEGSAPGCVACKGTGRMWIGT